MTDPVRIGDATLYLGDCLGILPTLGPVDAVVTDPPYNVGYAYSMHDDRMNDADYLWVIRVQKRRVLLWMSVGGLILITS
jgi:DNA modification methylase